MGECEGHAATGLEYLEAVTRLLQRRRLAEPAREMWEAADLQWAWRRDRHGDPENARVWCDPVGPVAAVVVNQWTAERSSCEILAGADFAPAWEFAARRSAQLGQQKGASIEMEMVVEGDIPFQHAARTVGYVPSDEIHAASWLDPSGVRAPRRPLAAGYEITTRADTWDRPHPMIGRNGDEVEDRLRECSLYDPRLDLAALAPNGTVAGYALFWADPITRVGLVEPMRVEEAHAGRGLAAHLLAVGLRRLVERGCTRLKVASDPSNPIAQKLYGAAGFVICDHTRTWRYERPR